MTPTSPSSDRRPLAAGNWKMHRTASEAVSLVRALTADLRARGLGRAGSGAEVLVCPPFTALGAVSAFLTGEGSGSGIGLGAQTLHWEDQGAFTGEVSAPMLKDGGCSYVIIGHSERRQLFGETDQTVRHRLAAASRHGLRPILCVGETWEERRAGRTEAVITGQMEGALDVCPDGLCVAYEPVWAIGSGRAAEGEDAQEVASLIRGLLRRLLGEKASASTRILYGGSVKPDNIRAYSGQPDIDGALVGGASLDAAAFAEIAARLTR